MFCLTKFSTHFIGPQFECPSALPTEIIGKLSQGTASRSTFTPGRKEGNGLFNDALNTFFLRLYGVAHMVKDHSDSER